MYSEPKPNIEHIRAVAEDIAARLTKEHGISISVETSDRYSFITLPCRTEAVIQISDVDSGMLPLQADIFYGGCFQELYSVDYGNDGEFAEAVCGFVKGFAGRQLKVTVKSTLFGGTETKAEYLEDSQWKPLFEKTDKSFIMRIFTWNSKTTVSEYDFRLN